MHCPLSLFVKHAGRILKQCWNLKTVTHGVSREGERIRPLIQEDELRLFFFFTIRQLDSLINVWEARWPTRTCESNCCLSACSEDSPEGWLGGNPQGRPGTEPLTAGLEIQQGAGKNDSLLAQLPLFHTVISSRQIDGLMEDWNKDHIPTH